MRYALLAISFCFFLVPLSADATAYYVDFTPGIVNGNGLATTTPFNNLDSFTETARSAGDIAFVRRNTASTTNPSDLDFTSDGTIANPIIISADNDNLWNDASTTAQTYTVAVATSTFTASATITAVQAGDWFYVSGDCTQTYNSTSLNNCEFFYEVATVSGTQLTLHMPYKGNQSGSGLTLINMGKNPQWHTSAQDFQWNFDTDNYWLIKGMDVRGTDANGGIEVDSSLGTFFMDLISIGDGTTALGINATDDKFIITVRKSRMSGYSGAAIGTVVVDTFGVFNVSDSILTPASGGFGGIGCPTSTLGLGICTVRDTKVLPESRVLVGGGSDGIVTAINTNGRPRAITSTVGKYYSVDTPSINQSGTTEQGLVSSDGSYTTKATSTVLRSGGGPSSIQVLPTTNTATVWDFTKIMLFEYPIYTNTASKQYDVYFNSTSTAGWTNDPTNTELWIECEYWAHDTNATSTRKINKSTGLIDFNGSTSWQSLSVTCQPTQTGILYLRGWYAKTKESGKMNEFYVDGTPVIN